MQKFHELRIFKEANTSKTLEIKQAVRTLFCVGVLVNEGIG